MAYRDPGRAAEARAEYDRAIALAPDEPIRHNRAVVHLEAGRPAEADLAHGLARHERNPSMLAVPARTALVRGDLTRAHRLLSRGLAHDPAFADALCVAGWVKLAGSRFADARGASDRALARPAGRPRSSDRAGRTALDGRGLAQQNQGRDADFEAAFALRPGADQVVAARSVRPAGSGTSVNRRRGMSAGRSVGCQAVDRSLRSRAPLGSADSKRNRGRSPSSREPTLRARPGQS